MANERVTTIAVYAADRDWLAARQRKVSFERTKSVPMCDLIRELVEYIQQQEADAAS